MPADDKKKDEKESNLVADAKKNANVELKGALNVHNGSAEKAGKVTVRIWPRDVASSSPKTWFSLGHAALQTHSGGEDNKGEYISFWPGSACRSAHADAKSKGKEYPCTIHDRDHFHTRDIDKTIYQKEPPAGYTYRFETLDVEAIHRRFRAFKDSKFEWSLLGSSLLKENDHSSKNCAGICLFLLEAGGLFSRLGYKRQNDYYFPGHGFMAGVAGAGAATAVLIGGACGGAMTLETGPGAIAGYAIGALAGFAVFAYTSKKLYKSTFTPDGMRFLLENLKLIETSLFLQANDFKEVERRVQSEIQRLTKKAKGIFFDDKAASDKAIKLKGALKHAKEASYLLDSNLEFLTHRVNGLSILDIINENRFRSSVSRPTKSYQNLFLVDKSKQKTKDAESKTASVARPK